MLGPNIIDAGASRRERRVVPAGQRLSGEAASLFARARNCAHSAITENFDSADAAVLKARFDTAVHDLNERTLRADAISAQGSGLSAGKLRHVLARVLEEKYALPTALELFPVDTSVPLGKREIEVHRFYEAGEAAIYRSGDGSQIPKVSYSQESMTFRVRQYVTSAVWSFFEEQQAQAAEVEHVARLLRVARRTLELFLNEMTWYGDDQAGIYGILNYPWLDREVSDLAFGGTDLSGGTVSYLQELNNFVNRAYHASKGVLGPNKMVTSPRVADWIMQTPYLDGNGAGGDRMLGEVFLATSRIEDRIEQAHELENVLGDGVDAIFFYRDDVMGVANMLSGGGIQALPLHQTDIDRRQIMFYNHGGVQMLEVGNNLCVFVTYSAS